jgi:hypothetical protein
MSDEKFKLPQSSYEELTKVIKAYGHFSEPASLDEISKFIGLHATIISRNAGFLIGLDILEAGARKVPTTNGRRLAHALEHNMPDEIRTWWRKIASSNEFLRRLLAAIRIRSGMDQQTLEAHIAYSAGQPKKPQFMTGARTVIDILRAAELIKEVDGKYIADQNQSVVPEPILTREIPLAPTADITTQRSVATVVSSALPAVQSGAVIRIQININCTAAELPGLGQHIKKLMDELSSPSPNAESKEERSDP